MTHTPRPEIDLQFSQQIEERSVTLDGARMRYLSGGAGPSLLLVHGLLGYSFSWRFVMPALARQATVYAVDMLGTGYSDRPANLDCSLRACAQRLLRFLDRINVASCHLLGTSHGGAVVMMAAALAPDRVRRLILVAPVNPWSAHGKWLAPFLSSRPICWLFHALALGLGMAHGIFLRRLYGDARRIPPGTLEGYSAPLRIPGALRYGLGVLRSWNNDLRELQSVLPRIAHLPTLLIWGSADAAVAPRSATPLCRQFRDCRSLVFEGVGHLPYEEDPQEFNRAVVEFLDRSDQRFL